MSDHSLEFYLTDHSSMVVPWNPHCLRDPLELHRRPQRHPLVELADHAALDRLPGRLRGRVGGAVALLDVDAAAVEFGLVQQDVGGAAVQVDADAVAGLQQREAAAGRRLR